MQTIINWIDPDKQTPPFCQPILVLLGSQIREATGEWHKRLEIREVVMSEESPMDEDLKDLDPDDEDADDRSQYEQLRVCEDEGYKFSDFQFFLTDAFNDDEDEHLDWFSDGIVRWAPRQDFSELMREGD
ncbi:conserved hypothetical protein [Gammaproteobacteria bacterium]